MKNKGGVSVLIPNSNIKFYPKSKRAQVTIFIIIAIIIVAGVVGFFLLRGNLIVKNIPTSIEPAYNSFLSCLEDKTSVGIDVLESQAGYIVLPELKKGSSYMPFSSQLNFLGNPIPYWYYVSENNLPKEQVPSKQDMQNSLGKFIEDKITECNFDNYYQEGFEITQGVPKVSISINNNDVDVKLSMDLEINKGEDSALIGDHQISFKSNLGALYNSAKVIYEKEQKELFLENYGIDTLRLYAPVDGVDMTCSPKTWNADQIFNDLKDAIETNTLALSTQSPSSKEEKYFFVNVGANENVRFINSRNWSHSFEVSPSQENILIANPVGNQQGLGILGFCYVPYHFVYDVKYPVLVQVYSGNEIFQFPLAVVIQGNKPRVALNSTAKAVTSDLCQYKNTPTTVQTYDTNLNPVDSSISYECFGEACTMGDTSSGILTTNFPQCVNGNVIAKAEGFEEAKVLYSTVQEGSAEVILNKLYDLNIDLKLDGVSYNGKALMYFASDFTSKVVSYPEQKNVNLSEGQYEISVYIYKDSSIQIKETTTQQCMDVPSSGIGGVFGTTEKKCFDVQSPAQIVSNVLAGGGKQNYSVSEDELKNSNAIHINAGGLTTPKTIEDIQNNYAIFDDKTLDISFK